MSYSTHIDPVELPVGPVDVTCIPNATESYGQFCIAYVPAALAVGLGLPTDVWVLSHFCFIACPWGTISVTFFHTGVIAFGERAAVPLYVNVASCGSESTPIITSPAVVVAAAVLYSIFSGPRSRYISYIAALASRCGSPVTPGQNRFSVVPAETGRRSSLYLTRVEPGGVLGRDLLVDLGPCLRTRLKADLRVGIDTKNSMKTCSCLYRYWDARCVNLMQAGCLDVYRS